MTVQERIARKMAALNATGTEDNQSSTKPTQVILLPNSPLNQKQLFALQMVEANLRARGVEPIRQVKGHQNSKTSQRVFISPTNFLPSYRIEDGGQTKVSIKANGDTAEIKIIGEIDWWKNNSESFISQLDGIKNAGIKKLKCYMNSAGGSVWEANEIYNQIKSFEGDKSLELGAICASAATIVAMAFDKNKTVGASNLAYMIHNPRTNVLDAEVKDLETSIQLLKNTKETISKLYEVRTGLSKKEVEDKMDATWWMTAETAKQYGFIGSIKSQSDMMPEDTDSILNKYNFSIPTNFKR
jgi:ATP-dependent protease ClpP protease subunit